MFFTLSKIGGFLIEPLSLIALAAFVTFAAALFNRRKTAAVFALLAFLIAGLGGWSTLGTIGLAVLEERFPKPALPPFVDGIIVLGGGFANDISAGRGHAELNEAGDRYVEAAVLARQFPHARIVITGGNAGLTAGGAPEAALAPAFFERLGIAPARIERESQSRNTDENARFVAAMIGRKPGETWLLVTSAYHMPRSMGLFRKAGLSVTHWPVDYRTEGVPPFRFQGGSAAGNMTQLSIAIREAIGLIAYRLSGRIAEFFPAP